MEEHDPLYIDESFWNSKKQQLLEGGCSYCLDEFSGDGDHQEGGCICVPVQRTRSDPARTYKTKRKRSRERIPREKIDSKKMIDDYDDDDDDGGNNGNNSLPNEYSLKKNMRYKLSSVLLMLETSKIKRRQILITETIFLLLFLLTDSLFFSHQTASIGVFRILVKLRIALFVLWIIKIIFIQINIRLTPSDYNPFNELTPLLVEFYYQLSSVLIRALEIFALFLSFLFFIFNHLEERTFLSDAVKLVMFSIVELFSLLISWFTLTTVYSLSVYFNLTIIIKNYYC